MSKWANCSKCGKEAEGVGKGWVGSGADVCEECSTPKSSSVGELTVKISVDTTELDVAIEKVERLIDMLMSVDSANSKDRTYASSIVFNVNSELDVEKITSMINELMNKNNSTL